MVSPSSSSFFKLTILQTVRSNHAGPGRPRARPVRQIHQRSPLEPGQVPGDLQGGQAEHVPVLRQRLDADAEPGRVPGGARICQGGQGQDRGV